MCLLNHVTFRGGRLTGVLFCVAASIATMGCSSGEKPSGRLAISGEVQLDGQPLDTGSIQFEPAEKTSKLNAGAVITAGKYQISAENGLPPGKYKVSRI